jgi:hypothetical protein
MNWYLKEGWTDGDGLWSRSHKFLRDRRHPICDKNITMLPRFFSDPIKVRPPKNACRNCLRIEAARKKKGVK